MYDLEKELNRYIRLRLRNQNEMYVMEIEIRTKCTTWIKKLDRNVRHGVRNKNDRKELD